MRFSCILINRNNAANQVLRRRFHIGERFVFSLDENTIVFELESSPKLCLYGYSFVTCTRKSSVLVRFCSIPCTQDAVLYSRSPPFSKTLNTQVKTIIKMDGSLYAVIQYIDYTSIYCTSTVSIKLSVVPFLCCFCTVRTCSTFVRCGANMYTGSLVCTSPD